MSEIYPIAVPKWGIEMVEGTINTWNKREGDAIARGDEVFEMESDKIVNVWEAPVEGVLRRVIAAAGYANASPAAEPEAGDASATSAPASGKPGGDANTRSSPSVRRLAQELGVDLNTVTGSGRRGRITEDDVRAAASGADGEGAGDNVQVTPLSATRKTIARRLTEAKQQIPHFYLSAEFELDGLLAQRAQLNAAGDVKVSVNDLMVWCVARALMAEPRVNVNLVGEDVHQFADANIAVAVATQDGLYPATVRKVQDLSVQELATRLSELAGRAADGKLSKDDISGGSFTVSNLGMFGVNSFTAIINPPMGAILALGKGEQRVVVKDGEPAVATVINATLSCDHRVIDGAVGARFLQALGKEIDAL